PNYITYDGAGNLFITDGNEIRQLVIATGVVTTFAGNTAAGSADGIGTASSFSSPAGIVCDKAGNLYVADYNNYKIRHIVISTAMVTTLAGSGTNGSTDGTGTAAKFNRPSGITYDGNGNLYVADRNNNEIRKIVISFALVSTYAGSTTHGTTDGIATAARFYIPTGITYDGGGNLYVADYDNNRIRKIVLPNTYSVLVTDGNGCVSGASLNVTVNTTPTVTVSADVIGGTTICAGTNDTLMANASGNGSFTYKWSTTGTNDTTLVRQGGNYTVTVTDVNKCSAIATESVTVNPTPTVNVSGTNTISLGSSDTLTAGGAVSYVWTTGSTSDTTMIKPLATTTYTVIGTDGNGCKGTSTFTVTVGPTSVSNVVANDKTSLYPNPTISSINLSFEMQGVGVPTEVKIIDGIGREVMSKNTTISNGKVLTLDVSMLAQGLYYVKVITSDNTQVEKFIKQ
ncbi:MAG TPA: T9SS type A sorting domain-containing protein, partial [Bacteroidia bacterium]|nr:T9SS type A sorting domain-containing protein [Bacteroidia bacterium]